jgi:cryptochrome
VFSELFKKWNVKRLTFEVDIEPYPQKRDAAVTKLAEKNGIEVITHTSHTIYNTEA